MVFGDLLGFIGGAAGGIDERNRSKRANRKNQETVNSQLELAEQRGAARDEGFARALPFLQQMLGTIDQGNRSAQGAVGRSTEAALTGLADRNKVAGKDAVNRLARGGLYNSTLATGITSAAARDTNRQSNEVLSRSGGVLANLILGGSAAKAGGLATLANFEERRGAAKGDVFADQSRILGGVRHTAAPGIAEGYGQLFGSLGGLIDKYRTAKKGD